METKTIIASASMNCCASCPLWNYTDEQYCGAHAHRKELEFNPEKEFYYGCPIGKK